MSKFLEMSDEDFLNEPPPPMDEVVVVADPEVVTEPAVVEPVVTPEVVAPVTPEVVVTEPKVATNPLDAEDDKLGTPPVDVVTPTTTDPAVTTPEVDPVVAEVTAPNYEDFYKQVMAPFKADGKTIELKTPEEAVQLMKMGANYTRKMQELQPQRKLLLMLENNGLDEGKLSYLIDLDKKDPKAILKLVKDAGIDPLDLDVSVDPAYQAGNHTVSDAESNFRSVLDTLSSSTEGKETLRVINSTWDQASKELLWKDAEAMNTIHQQRESGVYDLISTEVERQKTLGNIPAGTSFMQAYQAVGNHMVSNGGFDSLIKPAAIVPVAPVVTRVAPVKSVVENGDKASAASPPRSTSRPATVAINPLAMSDEDFLKMPPPVG